MNGTNEIGVIESSGNVFADLGIGEAGEALTKAELARAISTAVGQRGLTQTEAAMLLGIDQPKISALARGRLAGFSIDRLLRFLTALDQDVEILVKPKPTTRAAAQVSVVAQTSVRASRRAAERTRASRQVTPSTTPAT